MEKELFQQVFDKEKNHWWYVGMRTIYSTLLDKYLKKQAKILDAGAGTGFNLLFLKKYGKVQGIDYSSEAISLAKKRNLKIKKASIENIPFKDSSFDLVTCFDVLYHKGVKNDVKALKELNRVLAENGLLLIREPSFNFLYNTHDVKVHTRQRYTRKELTSKLKKAGFKIEKISYVNFFLFPLFIINRIFKSKESDLKKTPKFVNGFFKLFLMLESKLINFVNFPFGSSVICVARK